MHNTGPHHASPSGKHPVAVGRREPRSAVPCAARTPEAIRAGLERKGDPPDSRIRYFPGLVGLGALAALGGA